MNTSILKKAGILTGLLMIAAQAQAASVSVTLELSNVPQLPAGGEYLEVTISDGAAGAINFEVAILEDLADLDMVGNFGIQNFGFNFGDSGATAANIVGPAGWTVETNMNLSVFGGFDVRLSGTSSTRKDPLQFSIVGVDGDTPQDYLTKLSSGGVLFASHVAGFSLTYSNNEEMQMELTSAFIGGGQVNVVPLPPAMTFMLSGASVLGAMALRRRRREGADALAAAAA